MGAIPTEAQVQAVRGDITTFLATGKTVAGYGADALIELKLLLLNARGIKWSQVYTGSDATGSYIDNTDGDGNNALQLQRALCLCIIGKIFEDYALTAGADSWWGLAHEYRDRFETLVGRARLDIDSDESGTITDDEEQSVACGAPLVRC